MQKSARKGIVDKWGIDYPRYLCYHVSMTKKNKEENQDILVRNLPKSTNQKLKIKAIKEDKNVSLVVVEILKEYFNK